MLRYVSSIDSTLDSSLLSNIQKLFYEKIEVFGTVQFDKASIVTGIIKIFLKVCGDMYLARMHIHGSYLHVELRDCKSHNMNVLSGWEYLSFFCRPY